MKKLIIAVCVLVVLVAIIIFAIAHFVFDPEVIRAAIEKQASKALDAQVQIGSADISIFPRAGVSLGKVTVNGKFHITAETVNVSTSLRQLFDRRIEDAEIQVKHGLLELSPSYTPAQPPEQPAETEARPRPENNPSKEKPEAQSQPITIASIRKISIDDLQLSGGGKRVRLDAEGSLVEDKLKLDKLDVTTESSDIHGSGELINDPQTIAGNLTLTAKRLDLDELMAVVTSLASVFPKPSGPPPSERNEPEETSPRSPSGASAGAREHAAKSSGADHALHASITADSGKLYGMEFRDLKLTTTRSGPDVVFEPFSVKLFGGDVNGRVTISSRAMAASLAADVKITHADVAQFLKAIHQSPAATGQLNGTILLSGQGADFNAASSSMSGTANLSMSGGEIKGLDEVGKAVKMLGGTPTKPDAPKSYQELGGSFRIQPSGVSTDNFQLSAPDFQLKSKLSLTRSGALNGNAKLMFVETVSQQMLTKNRDLKYAAENNRIVLPAQIGGSMEHPKVLPDLGDITKRAAKSAIEEQATKALNKLFKKKKP